MLRLHKVTTISRNVTVRLPTDNPSSFTEGTITVKFRLLSKEDLAKVTAEGLEDREFTRRVVVDVSGLGDDAGNPIDGDAALAELLDGAWSSYLQAAVLGEFFEQYGDARVKNSKTSRGR